MAFMKKYYMRAKRCRLQSTVSMTTEPSISPESDSDDIGTINEIHFESPEVMPIVEGDLVLTVPEESQNINVNINSQKCNSSIENLDIHTFLSSWSLKHNVSHVAVNDLLKYFQNFFPDLPGDARTLLKTCRDVKTKTVFPGHYYHFGMEPCIKNLYLNNLNSLQDTTFELDINIDGLPLSKSSNSQVYPILCKLKGTHCVDMVGIYHGYEKPKNANDFLETFVSDITNLINNGVNINGQIYTVKINSFICDAPAKAYITYTKGHSGYASCTKCKMEGDYIANRICFPEIYNIDLRTDQDFGSKIQESHHNGTTILENIPDMDMVTKFPLDYMHLVCLGVVKKLLVILWCCGKPATKLSFQNISNISDSLLNMSKHILLEFNRKPRSLNEVKRWKATEFRQFLFYTGPVVLKNQISTERYINFLTLHVAITILSSRNYFDHLNYASDLFKYFVKTFRMLYGPEHISHNVHNLLHLTNDVRKYGPLDDFSSFPFENYLQSILRTLRTHDKPLSQIIKRHSEQVSQNEILQKHSNTPLNFPFCDSEHDNGPYLDNVKFSKQFKKVIFKDFILQNREPNNCCLLSNGSIVLIENIVLIADKFQIIARKFIVIEDFYKEPCPSSVIGIHSVSKTGHLEIFDVHEISNKYVKFPYKDKFVVFPLLHTV